LLNKADLSVFIRLNKQFRKLGITTLASEYERNLVEVEQKLTTQKEVS